MTPTTTEAEQPLATRPQLQDDLCQEGINNRACSRNRRQVSWRLDLLVTCGLSASAFPKTSAYDCPFMRVVRFVQQTTSRPEVAS